MTKSSGDGARGDGGSVVKVGELAATTGLTVRTLHYCDEIGLLSPSRRSGAGHRSYFATMTETLTQHRQLDVGEILDTLEDMAMLDTKIQRRIPTLVYRDIAAAHEFLTTAFGFEPGRIARAPDGTVYHAEVTAGDGVIWLHQVSERFGLQSPQALGACTEGMSIIVDDVDAHYRHVVESGAEIVYTPIDQPYGYREYSARDLEQRLWSFMAPLN